ncbi:hypothetical protein CBL_00173 [Carabus blaptoides fortunei]
MFVVHMHLQCSLTLLRDLIDNAVFNAQFSDEPGIVCIYVVIYECLAKILQASTHLPQNGFPFNKFKI